MFSSIVTTIEKTFPNLYKLTSLHFFITSKKKDRVINDFFSPLTPCLTIHNLSSLLYFIYLIYFICLIAFKLFMLLIFLIFIRFIFIYYSILKSKFFNMQYNTYARIAQRILVDFARLFLAHSSADGRITSFDTSL